MQGIHEELRLSLANYALTRIDQDLRYLQTLVPFRWYPSGLTAVDLFSRSVPWHQLFDTCHFMIYDAGENAPKPSFWIDTVHAAGLNCFASHVHRREGFHCGFLSEGSTGLC